jgi:hypothetical protein
MYETRVERVLREERNARKARRSDAQAKQNQILEQEKQQAARARRVKKNEEQRKKGLELAQEQRVNAAAKRREDVADKARRRRQVLRGGGGGGDRDDESPRAVVGSALTRKGSVGGGRVRGGRRGSGGAGGGGATGARGARPRRVRKPDPIPDPIPEDDGWSDEGGELPSAPAGGGGMSMGIKALAMGGPRIVVIDPDQGGDVGARQEPHRYNPTTSRSEGGQTGRRRGAGDSDKHRPQSASAELIAQSTLVYPPQARDELDNLVDGAPVDVGGARRTKPAVRFA